MQIPGGLSNVLEATPETLHGAVRFKGTRVFAQSLFDYTFKGKPVDVFLDHFPDVSREQAEALLNWEYHRIQHDFGYLNA